MEVSVGLEEGECLGDVSLGDGRGDEAFPCGGLSLDPAEAFRAVALAEEFEEASSADGGNLRGGSGKYQLRSFLFGKLEKLQ